MFNHVDTCHTQSPDTRFEPSAVSVSTTTLPPSPHSRERTTAGQPTSPVYCTHLVRGIARGLVLMIAGTRRQSAAKRVKRRDVRCGFRSNVAPTGGRRVQSGAAMAAQQECGELWEAATPNKSWSGTSDAPFIVSEQYLTEANNVREGRQLAKHSLLPFR